MPTEETNYRQLTTEFQVRDALGGCLSGDYKMDLKIAQKTYGVTFSEALYDEAYQNDQQP